ncbi:hypothetical protein ACF0H5_007576 [Mactra antiquata]
MPVSTTSTQSVSVQVTDSSTALRQGCSVETIQGQQLNGCEARGPEEQNVSGGSVYDSD